MSLGQERSVALDLARSAVDPLLQGAMPLEAVSRQPLCADITSHRTTEIGAWTDDEIQRATGKGVSRDGCRLRPPMGPAHCAKPSPTDLDVIAARLRTLAPLEK